MQSQQHLKPSLSPFINKDTNTIELHIENAYATQVYVAGTFNHWAHDQLPMHVDKDGVWTLELPMLPPGKYGYKFLIDGKMWVEDYENQYHEPDGVSGFNSILIIEN